MDKEYIKIQRLIKIKEILIRNNLFDNINKNQLDKIYEFLFNNKEQNNNNDKK